MKRWIYSLLILASFSISSMAVNAPLDSRGYSLSTIDWIGADTCAVTPATSGNTVVCSSGTSIAYGVISSSIAFVTGQYIVFRDTNTMSTSVSLSTVVIVSPVGTGSPSSATVPGSVNYFKFPVPIKFNNGIVVTPGASVPAGGQWTILYRKRNLNPGLE